MPAVIPITSQEFFPLLATLIDNGQTAKITVTGESMYPFLRDGLDSVELTQTTLDGVERGDIILIQRDDTGYVLHRVWKKSGEQLYLLGDAQVSIEGPVRKDQLRAKATALWRGGTRIGNANRWWRFCSTLWLFLRPLRPYILRMIRFLHIR